ncbi:MAG: glycosyltransferase family 39 protein [Candidatus Kapabacteria bacterium]|nr:glycosyltransferase family 39 protein [Candidatus Kapabacteria bacterium]
MFNREIKNYIIIAFAGLILFFPFLGNVHLFDWDEINFAEAAREMILTGDYLTVRIDYEPFHEKPPLFIWFQVISMKIFGVNEFAARFPNAVIGLVTLLILFNIGKKIINSDFGKLWALAYVGSLLPHFYFKSGIIDPTFNLFMFLAVYYLYRYHIGSLKLPESKGNPYLMISLAGFFTACAVLTKGPVGLLLPALTFLIFTIIKRKEHIISFSAALIYVIISIIPYLVWYLSVQYYSGAGLFDDFIAYHLRLLTTGDAGHSGPIYYHFVILLIGCFPASFFFFKGLRKDERDSIFQTDFNLILLILLMVVLVIFSIVKTKIIHYSSLSYFPITFFAARAMFNIGIRNHKTGKLLAIAISVIGFLLAIAIALFPIALMNVDLFIDKVTDIFTKAILSTKVEWQGWEWIVGLNLAIFIIIYLYYEIEKKPLKSYLALFGGVAFTIFLILPILAPKIDLYLQSAPNEFYKSLQGKEAYVHVLGYKSYAQYFYTMKPYHLSTKSKNIKKDDWESWLLEGKIDKPAYFVTNNKNLQKYLDRHPDLKLLYEKNGYAFLKRDKQE